MIVTYILTFSLLIMSGMKVLDAFFWADKKLTEKRSEFIRETKKSHQGGNITLMAALLTLMFSALLMFFAYKFKVELNEARYRKDSYLCFKYLNIETENYISDMVKFNWALRTAFAATFSVVATAEAKTAWDGLKIARNARHLYYIKNLITNKYCKEKISNLPYLQKQPFETNKAYLLTTNLDGTAKLKEEQWKITYYKKPDGIRLNKSFCLVAEMSAEGPFLPNFKIKTQEISMAGFSQLKCSSGFL
jgi:hypothetical protein